MGVQKFCLLVLVILMAQTSTAQQIESTPPLSQRSTINLSAGVPQYVGAAAANSNAAQSQWYYQDDRDSPTYSSPTLNGSADTSVNWKQVGLPYDANIPRTFLNQTSGGGQGSLKGNATWYRAGALDAELCARYSDRRVSRPEL